MKDRSQRLPTISRRQWLRGAGLSLAGLPLLRQMGRADSGGSPLRLVCWPMMNGAEASAFYPGNNNPTTLSLITEPLRKWANQVTFIKGVDIAGSSNHYAVRSTYSGHAIATYESADPTVKSVDQLIADHIAATSPTPLKSLHLGVIPADSINYYQRAGRSTFFFAPRPVDYEANPVTAFDRVFGGAPPSNGPTPTSPDFTKDARDVVAAEMGELNSELGTTAASEARKLTQHKDAWSSLLSTGKPPMAPAGSMPLSTPMPSVEKLRPALFGNPKDAYKRELFNDLFDAQVDNLARALVTGLTKVATLQAGSADNNLIVPVGTGYPHHLTSHGDQPTYNRLQQWYFGKLARLAQALDVPDPLDPSGKTVLHNTLIVVLAECLPVGHGSIGVPALLLGSAAGKIKPGFVNGTSITNKNLMATVLATFGLPPAHFGSTLISEIRS
ncbi:MAG TPA: DUF1552 domain-containing protein [Polyangia bacterium]